MTDLRLRTTVAALAAGLALPAVAAAQGPPVWSGPLDVSAGIEALPGPDTQLALDAVGGGTVAWSETDGSSYGYATRETRIYVRDGSLTGRLSARRLVTPDAQGVLIRGVARHRSGDVAVLTETREGDEAWALHLRRGPDGPFRAIALPPGVLGNVRVAIDTNRRVVVTWARGLAVRTASRARGTTTWTLHEPLIAGGRVVALDVQPNGRAIAVWDDDGTLTASVRRAVLVWEDEGAGSPVGLLGDERARRVVARIGVNGHGAVAWTTSVSRERRVTTRRARAAGQPPVSWGQPARIDEPGQIALAGVPDSGLAVGPTGLVASAWALQTPVSGAGMVRVRTEPANGAAPAVTEDAGLAGVGPAQRPEVGVDARGDVAVVADPFSVGPVAPLLMLRDGGGTWLPVRSTTERCASAPLRMTADVNGRALGVVCANAVAGSRITAYAVDGISPPVFALRG